ncbi:hypothetical protein D3C73_1380900 [compost metagenome]
MRQVADQLEHALGNGLAGGVWHRVGGLDHFDFLARGAVTVARHDQAGYLSLPTALDHLSHGSCGLAGADDDDPSRAIGRQMGFEHLLRMGGVDGCGEQLAQQLLRIDRHGGLPGFLLFGVGR